MAVAQFVGCVCLLLVAFTAAAPADPPPTSADPPPAAAPIAVEKDVDVVDVPAVESFDWSRESNEWDDWYSHESDERRAYCPYGTSKLNNRCYSYHQAPLSWDQAMLSCLHRNGHLVYISAYQEWHSLERHFHGLKAAAGGHYFVGAKRVGNSMWMWMNGRQVVMPWMSWGAGSGDCLQVGTSHLIPSDCATPAPYMCEYAGM